MHSFETQQRNLDELIAESRRIQDALIRVVVKLDLFADQLTDEVLKLQQATGVPDERIPARDTAPVSPAGGEADREGGGTHGGSLGGES